MNKDKVVSKNQGGIDKTIAAAYIAGAAVIIAAVISAFAVILKIPSTPPTVVPPAALEAELSKANILLADTPDKEKLVRQWLESDLQYQTMAQTILTALAGGRVINPIPLDVIIGKYRVSLGGTESTNFPPDQYKDIEKTKTAMFDTWKERHPEFPQKSFDEIVEMIK